MNTLYNIFLGVAFSLSFAQYIPAQEIIVNKTEHPAIKHIRAQGGNFEATSGLFYMIYVTKEISYRELGINAIQLNNLHSKGVRKSMKETVESVDESDYSDNSYTMLLLAIAYVEKGLISSDFFNMSLNELYQLRDAYLKKKYTYYT